MLPTHRPTYHFLPPRNWMNDPNGLMQVGGEYHLFYQHNPEAPWWGNMSWGHAVSGNLVHWRHLPCALKPDRPYDAAGVFSGCGVVADGVPTLVYTGVTRPAAGGKRAQVQCVATAANRTLTKWTKHPANPVIARPPEGYSPADFRDPYVWREGNAWQMVVGARRSPARSAVLRYTSRDLIRWRFAGQIFQMRTRKSGLACECPNLFRLAGRWVLILSPVPYGRAIYLVGRFTRGRFTPELRADLDAGGCLYAPQTFLAADGRRIMFGWLRERRTRRAAAAAGWAGVQTLPRVLTVGPDGRLRYDVSEEVSLLRGRGFHFDGADILPGEGRPLPGLAGAHLEIIAALEPGTARQVGLIVRRSPRGAEQTRIVWDRRGRLVADTTRSSTAASVRKDVRWAPLALDRGERLTLRVFLDASVIESFANARAVLTSRVYPARPRSVGIALFAAGGRARLLSLDAWEMKGMRA